jgi:hypothetical protein
MNTEFTCWFGISQLVRAGNNCVPNLSGAMIRSAGLEIIGRYQIIWPGSVNCCSPPTR